MKTFARIAAAIAVAVVLAGCTASTGGLFKRPLAASAGQVDAAEAARIISAYRASRGLGRVTVDPNLMKAAAHQAREMARANRMAHVLPGQVGFSRRIASSGYRASIAAENVGAGYATLDTAINRWQASPGHNKNLLHPQVTEIGIAVAHAPDSRYKSYWALVLAAPAPVAAAGPRVAVPAGGWMAAAR